MIIDKYRKLELIQRSLGIKHKLKVHDSMKAPDTHEDLAVLLLSKWELEDELHAIEEILAASRQATVTHKRTTLERDQANKNRESFRKIERVESN